MPFSNRSSRTLIIFYYRKQHHTHNLVHEPTQPANNGLSHNTTITVILLRRDAPATVRRTEVSDSIGVRACKMGVDNFGLLESADTISHQRPRLPTPRRRQWKSVPASGQQRRWRTRARRVSRRSEKRCTETLDRQN